MVKTLKIEAEYASEVLKTIPSGYIDKTICGCGLTTVALENEEDTVIAVPTICLAMNKSEQYPNERYAGKVMAVYGNTTVDEIILYWMTNRTRKIMVTYDSLYKIEFLLDRCKLVIDESNELLSRTKLKPEVIDHVFNIAYKYKDTVSFISATPTPLMYMPNWISDIDQVKIEWSNTDKAKPILCERTYPIKSLKNEFISPLKENGSMTVKGKSFSKLIIFINSIAQIVEVVKETRLDKHECGIICGDSLKNDIKICGIKRYVKGVLPKYLFITSSGFCGIDLEDGEAMTVVVSTTSQKWKMIDMLTDLKQAISRQRNKQNPNYGSFIYIYNQTIFKKSKNELLEELNGTYSKINDTIAIYDLAVINNRINGFEPYPDFRAYTFFRDNRYEINDQAFRADAYFILETRNQYSKGFDIRGGFDSIDEVVADVLPKDVTYKELVSLFNKHHVDGKMDWGGYLTKVEWISLIESSYRLFKQTWKDQTYAKKMVENHGDKMSIIKAKVDRKFSIGKRYTRKESKKILQEIYDQLKVERKAKHTDFSELFEEVRYPEANGERYVEIMKK
ncbi:MAG: hypothetical protein K0M50_05530 [Prolixibacteraceae bacterium]|nr:hypothetical protein [Prolixibacteraceae bacterium]